MNGYADLLKSLDAILSSERATRANIADPHSYGAGYSDGMIHAILEARQIILSSCEAPE